MERIIKEFKKLSKKGEALSRYKKELKNNTLCLGTKEGS